MAQVVRIRRLSICEVLFVVVNVGSAPRGVPKIRLLFATSNRRLAFTRHARILFKIHRKYIELASSPANTWQWHVRQKHRVSFIAHAPGLLFPTQCVAGVNRGVATQIRAPKFFIDLPVRFPVP